MAIAKFNSLRGEKLNSALILVKSNPLEFSSTPVYVPRDGVKHFAGKDLTDEDKGFEFEIPDGYRLVDIIDTETGEIRTTKPDKNGNVQNLKTLSYS